MLTWWTKLSQRKRGKLGSVEQQTCNKMIFPGPNRAFGCIASVHAGRDELENNFFFCHIVFQDGTGFIVKSLEFGSEASFH